MILVGIFVKINGIIGVFCMLPVFVVAQEAGESPAEGSSIEARLREVPSVVRAVRAAPNAPDVDGRLDDEAWRAAPPLTEFLQKNPVEGAVPSESTEVRFVYTDRALYVGFRGYDREPDRVYGRLMRRDQRAAADGFSVIIDSYYDRRTAFEITINPAGTRRDVFIYNDGRGQDQSWDPVYDWATQTDSLGWTVELRIPFSQLRFPPSDSVVFGVRLKRNIVRRNEEVNWPYFPRDQAGEVSNYADLVGIQGLPSPRRVELLPYTASSATFEPAEAGNPFETGRSSTIRAGADLKVGVTSGLTLDLTANPDFGQVEADAAEVNLTAFESFFAEKRPFFVEGTNLFQFGLAPAARMHGGFGRGGREGLVYTRRIGRSPQVFPETDGGYAADLDQTTILGASKLTGQLGGGWALGLMQAVTAKEQAQIVDSVGLDGRSPVEPMTSYTAVRVERNAMRGRLAYGAMGTATARRLDEPAFNNLHSRAYSGGADMNLRLGGDKYEFGTAFMGSRVEGSEEAIISTQRNSRHYFQRPDQTNVAVDSTRTSLSGYSSYMRIAKVVGVFTWEAQGATRSPGFEINDLGYMRQTGYHSQKLQMRVRQLRPGRLFRQFTWQVQEDGEFSHEWERTKTNVQSSVNADFHNYWNLSITGERSLSALSTTLLRGGAALQQPGSWRGSVRGRTDWQRPYWLNGGVSHRLEDVSDATTTTIDGSINIRPPGSFSASIRGRLNWSTSDRQYLSSTTVGDSLYYLFGRIDRQELSTTIRFDVALTSRMSFELYAEPFLSAGEYGSFRLVADPRADAYADRFDPLDDDQLVRPGNGETVEIDVNGDADVDFYLSDPDFRVVSLRTNAVLRWEFSPGSTLFLVWQQSRRDYTQVGRLNFGDAFGDVFTTPGTNSIAMKVAYWLGS
jgi:hypothetical protein